MTWLLLYRVDVTSSVKSQKISSISQIWNSIMHEIKYRIYKNLLLNLAHFAFLKARFNMSRVWKQYKVSSSCNAIRWHYFKRLNATFKLSHVNLEFVGYSIYWLKNNKSLDKCCRKESEARIIFNIVRFFLISFIKKNEESRHREHQQFNVKRTLCKYLAFSCQ